MADHVYCPRCGARDSFIKGYLPETCLCRICQSQLDWREIPNCGPDCKPAPEPQEQGRDVGGGETGGGAPSAGTGQSQQG